MRQYRSSGSGEGVMGNHDSYSDLAKVIGCGQVVKANSPRLKTIRFRVRFVA